MTLSSGCPVTHVISLYPNPSPSHGWNGGLPPAGSRLPETLVAREWSPPVQCTACSQSALRVVMYQLLLPRMDAAAESMLLRLLRCWQSNSLRASCVVCNALHDQNSMPARKHKIYVRSFVVGCLLTNARPAILVGEDMHTRMTSGTADSRERYVSGREEDASLTSIRFTADTKIFLPRNMEAIHNAERALV